MGVERKILKGVGIGGGIALVGWLIGFGTDQGPKSAEGQPLGWPTRTSLATVTSLPTTTIDIQATVRAILTASAPTPDIRATVNAALTAAATPSSAATPDIAGTVSAILTSVPQPPTPVSPATPFILKPEIIKPEVVKPEVVKPEVIFIQPQPASRSAEPDLAGTAISEATLNALVAKDRAALQATATAKVEGTVTAEAKQTASADIKTATAEARLTPTVVGNKEEREGTPWACLIGLGIFAGIAGLAGGALYRDRIVTVYHTIRHHPPHAP